MRCVIVGSRFKGPDAIAAVQRLKTGDRVLLIKEPDNQVDSRAIAVWRTTTHLGYIPRTAHAELYRLLGDRQEIAAVICATAILDAKPPILPKLEIAEEPDLLNPPPARNKADE